MARLQWKKYHRPHHGRKIEYLLIDLETDETLEHLSGWLDSERSMEELGDRRGRLSAEYERAGHIVRDVED